MATSSGMRIPMGIGSFYYNGICIASYKDRVITIGKGKGTIIRIVKDEKNRIYLWARFQNLSLFDSISYSLKINYILISDEYCLGSFCGDIGRSTMLSPNDLKVVSGLDCNQQLVILSLCYLLNICAPFADAFFDSAENAIQGSAIPDVQSFITKTYAQTKMVVYTVDVKKSNMIDCIVCFVFGGGVCVILMLFLIYAIVL